MAKKKVKIPRRQGGRSKKNQQQQMLEKFSQIQEQLMEAQSKLEEQEFEATSGGGAVTATVKGNLTLASIKIDPDVIDEDDVEMLEDLVVAAVNEAQKQASAASESQTNSFTGGLSDFGLPDIPGL